jgi:hypothetical protein
LPHPPGKELVNGDSALYLGRQYQIEVVRDGSEEIRFEQRFLIPSCLSGERKHMLRNWCMDRAKQWLLENGQILEEDI